MGSGAGGGGGGGGTLEPGGRARGEWYGGLGRGWVYVAQFAASFL